MENEELDVSNVRSKDDLSDFLTKVDLQQSLGPFPTRDSGIIKELKGKLANNAVGYDNEPVEACPLCESLRLIEVDGNLECFNCGNEVNAEDLLSFSSIFSYLSRDENSESTD